MAIELRNQLTITEETKIYGHNTVDIDGMPTDAGNGDVGQIVNIVDTKYIQGIKTDIDNIKAKLNGEIYRTQLVDANAYQIDVPSPVFPYAEVQKLKGKSVVWNQLRSEYRITTDYGITISSNDDGTVNIRGTVTNAPNYGQLNITESINFKRDGRKYYIASNVVTPKGFGIHGYDINSSKSFIFSTTYNSDWNGSIYIYVEEGDVLNISNFTVNILDLTTMFGSGNEPILEECNKIFSADYYPFDAGTIKSFPVKTVKSVGKNLLNPSKLRDGDYDGINQNIRISIDLKDRLFVKKGTKVSLSFTPTNIMKRIWLIITDSNNAVLETLFANSLVNMTVTTTQDGYLTPIFGGTLNSNGSWGLITVNDVIEAKPQLEFGEITPYKSYMESTIDLSSVTTDMKSALSVADEWQNGKVTKRVGVVDMGTLDWSKNISEGFFFSNSNVGIKLLNSVTQKANFLCKDYQVKTQSEWNQYDPCISGLIWGNGLLLNDSRYTNVSDLKSALSGVMLYYELDTPTEKTVPLTEQFIDVESKGTLTFISDESVQMPIESTTKFVVNLEEV